MEIRGNETRFTVVNLDAGVLYHFRLILAGGRGLGPQIPSLPSSDLFSLCPSLLLFCSLSQTVKRYQAKLKNMTQRVDSRS